MRKHKPDGELYILNPYDPAQRAAYEHAFYDAYADLTDNTLIRDLWLWDDEAGRLQTRIPYEDQVIFGWRGGGGLLAAFAVNLSPTQFQASAFGFQRVPYGNGGPSCEILNFITTPRNRLSGVRTYKTFVRDHCFGRLRDMGYEMGYCTSTERRKRGYLLFGAVPLAETTVNGEARHLMLWDFPALLTAEKTLVR